jgi:hypothetical protein
MRGVIDTIKIPQLTIPKCDYELQVNLDFALVFEWLCIDGERYSYSIHQNRRSIMLQLGLSYAPDEECSSSKSDFIAII